MDLKCLLPIIVLLTITIFHCKVAAYDLDSNCIDANKTLDVSLFITEGFALGCHQFWSAKTKDVTECARLCTRRLACKSFNYDTKERICELNREVYKPDMDLDLGKDLVYSDISSWSTKIDPCCHDRPCRHDEVCIPAGQTGQGGQLCSHTCFKLYCEKGWYSFEGNCYYFGLENLNYEDAKTKCGEMGSTLVQVDSVSENNFLKTKMMLLPRPKYGYWSDLYEVTVNNQERWRTTNDTLDLKVADWDSRQPDDYENSVQKCTMFYAAFNYRWVDIECEGSRSGRAMCEQD